MDKHDILDNSAIESFFDAVLTLNTRDECRKFFEDICTIGESKAIVQRLEVANLLFDNITYQEISSRTGASTATISRVNRCLNYGAGGYVLAIRRMRGLESK